MTFTLSGYEAARDLRRLDGGKFDSSNKNSRLAIHTSDYRIPKVDNLVRVVRDTAVSREQWIVCDKPGKFYLAGPMRGIPLSNFPAFLTAASVLRARGFEIFSPAEKDLAAGFDISKPVGEQKFDIGAAFRWDFKAVVETCGIILLPGWENSVGAKAERLVAHLSEQEIYVLNEQFELKEAPPMSYVLQWLESRQARPAPAPSVGDDD